MNRRDFVTAGLGTLASVPFAHTTQTTDSAACPPAAAQAQKTGLEIDFTGLFAFELRPPEAQLELHVVLVDAKKARLKDVHVPLLMMPLDAWSPIPTANRGYISPSIVNFGGTPMAVWSLVSTRLWVASSHPKYAGPDNCRNLTFDDSPIGTQPDPPDDPTKWRSRRWFAPLKDLVGGKAQTGEEKLEVNAKKVTSFIRLTRGVGAGRMPRLDCERYRVYRLGDSICERAYATQMYVEYGVTIPSGEKTVVNLGITDKELAGDEPFFIGVKVKKNELTPVTIMNLPVTHGHKPHHYEAFYNLVGKKGKKVLPQECKVPITVMQTLGLAQLPNSPDPDCIPPSL